MTDGCQLETRGSFGRKYADCEAEIDEAGLTTSSTDIDYSRAYGKQSADWLNTDDPEQWDQAAWDNISASWDSSTFDDTANFTGMDEYWAGMRQFDEGEEQVRDLPPISRPSPRKSMAPPTCSARSLVLSLGWTLTKQT